MLNTLSLPHLLEGFVLGFTLLVPIGMQNMYVLRQGALGKHPVAAALVCSLSDSILIIIGALGVGSVIAANPLVRRITVVAGILFIGWYGTKSFIRTFKQRTLLDDSDSTEAANLRTVILSALGFSFLNPHAVLDTTVLLGSVASQISTSSFRISFTIGACIASWIWFCGLGIFARLIRPFFYKPIAAQILDGVVCVVMYWVIWILIRAEWFSAAH
ncbi:Putative amino-acid transporter YggA [Chlamydiales bacterium SCGC AG-110-P3]|nr:Putative amino-acid transporter YggA [Chlamydiales bacterium SCGC AG-110-P3]